MFKISVVVPVYNAEKYHREYDFVSLGFVLAMVMAKWDGIPVYLRVSSITCLFSEFFYERIGFQFGWPGFVTICFVTYAILLVALMKYLCKRID